MCHTLLSESKTLSESNHKLHFDHKMFSATSGKIRLRVDYKYGFPLKGLLYTELGPKLSFIFVKLAFIAW